MDFCIDTNVLFSFQKGINLGESPGEVAKTLVDVGKCKSVHFYMPPRIVDELYLLIEPNVKKSIDELLTYVTVQSPTIHNQTIGVQVLYDFVDECRSRTRKGLHIADEVIMQTAQSHILKSEMTKIDLQKSLQPIKESLRLRYRNATRTGFIDSVADLDLLFLSKETDAHLVSADEGVVLWGRKMGVKEMSLPIFGDTIRKILTLDT